jgi:hypothetical protein
MCPTCIGFMTDWLRLPPSPSSFSLIKCHGHETEIATLFHDVLTRLSESKRLEIIREYSYEYPSDDVHGGFILLGLVEKRSSDMAHLIAFIEDNCSPKQRAVRSWTGFWLLRFWCSIFTLHKEHTKAASPSRCVEPIGMKQYKKTQDGFIGIVPSFKNEVASSNAITWKAYMEYYSFYS